jgi:hypothetical protein
VPGGPAAFSEARFYSPASISGAMSGCYQHQVPVPLIPSSDISSYDIRGRTHARHTHVGYSSSPRSWSKF